MLSSDQGVMGITYDGYCSIRNLYQLSSVSEDEDMSMILMKWYGYTNLIDKQNKKQIEVMCKLGRLWKSAGINMLLFKGQANALYYPRPTHRNIGDIDCYLMGNFKQGNEIYQESILKKLWYYISGYLFKTK